MVQLIPKTVIEKYRNNNNDDGGADDGDGGNDDGGVKENNNKHNNNIIHINCIYQQSNEDNNEKDGITIKADMSRSYNGGTHDINTDDTVDDIKNNNNN